MNTDFQKVFDQILTQAKLAEEKMMERAFVFSDMEFDQASSNPWETNYEAIKRKFPESGSPGPPEMVFSNLRTSSSMPVPKEKKGVALVSRFSKNQLKLFLDVGRALTPAKMMQAAITGDEYEALVIFD